MTIEFKTGSTEPGPVYICHGAEDDQRHFLTIVPKEDSPWGNQKVSCYDLVGEPSPSVRIAPEPGVFQTFLLTTGAKLELHCPANGTDCDLNLRLRSEFTAELYEIPMRLGHYRREILDSRSPIGVPVKGDTVTAQITVGSFYTKGVLNDITVVWSVNGEEVTIPTSDSGISRFDYQVNILGEQTITATVHSPYDATPVEKSFKIKVYEDNPWKGATLTVNGKVVGWNEPIFLPRGQASDVTVEAPPEIAKQFKLELAEGGGLNIDASPKFSDWVPGVDGKFNWTLTPADGERGLVTLVFLSLEVLLPWEHRCLVMSDDLSDEVDQVLVGGVPSPADGAMFFRNEPRTVTLTYKPDSPLQDYPLALTGTPLTGVQPGNLTVTSSGKNTWAVNSHTNSGTFKLELKGADMSTGITLPVCKVISRNLADEVIVKLNGVAIPATGADFIGGGEAQTLTLDYKNAEMLRGVPLALDWVPDYGLETGDLASQPPLRQFSTIHKWALTGAAKDGTFKLKLSSEGGAVRLLTPTNRLLGRYKLRFLKKLNGEYVELPVPPAVIRLPEGYYDAAVRVTGPNDAPVANVSLTVEGSAILLPTMSRTDSSGISSGQLILPPGEYHLSAVSTLGGKNYMGAIRLNVRG